MSEQRSSVKPMGFEKQIISVLSIFSHQMQAIVFIIFQLFFATRTVLKNGECLSGFPPFQLEHSQSRDAFRPIVCERKYLLHHKLGLPVFQALTVETFQNVIGQLRHVELLT